MTMPRILNKALPFNRSVISALKDLGRKKSSKPLLAILTVFLLMLLFHFRIPFHYSLDDRTFFTVLHNEYGGNYFSYLSYRFTHWSSRLVIEFVLLFSVNHFTFWRWTNALMMTLAAVLPPYLLKGRTQVKVFDVLFSSAIFFLIPLSLFKETGWIATTTNYLWVYALGLVAMLPITQIIRKNRANRSVYFLGLIATIYATNQEQMAALFFGFLLLFALYLYLAKKNYKLLVPFFVITIANLLLIQFSPGNKVRYAQEVKTWFADFDQLSLLKKFEIGYSSTLRHFFFDNQLVPLFLLGLILYGYILKNKLTLTIPYLLSGITLFISLFVSWLSQLGEFPFLTKLLNQFNDHGTLFTIRDSATWFPDILLTFLIIGMTVSLLSLINEPKKKMLVLILILSLLAVRLIMGFSPTIWASGTRTYLFSYGLMIFLALILSEQLTKDKSTRALLGTSTFLIGLISFLVHYFSL